jgi:hypothetical protein
MRSANPQRPVAHLTHRACRDYLPVSSEAAIVRLRETNLRVIAILSACE